jgi:hypothetical protein
MRMLMKRASCIMKSSSVALALMTQKNSRREKLMPNAKGFIFYYFQCNDLNQMCLKLISFSAISVRENHAMQKLCFNFYVAALCITNIHVIVKVEFAFCRLMQKHSYFKTWLRARASKSHADKVAIPTQIHINLFARDTYIIKYR